MLTRQGTHSTLLSPLFRMMWVAILFLSAIPPAQSLRAQSSETLSNDSAMDSAPQLQSAEGDAPTTVVPASIDATPQTVPIDRYYGNLPAPRTFMAAATVLPQKRTLLIGGQDTAGTPTSQILAVDMAGGTSTILGNLPVALTRLAAAYSPSNDTVYTFGGDNGNQRVNTIYAINPATGGVRTLAATLPVALLQIGAVYHPGLNKILLIGGSTSIVNGATRTIYLFDPATETITTSFANVMPVGFAGVMAVYSAAVNKVFYVGSNNTSLFAVTLNGGTTPPTIETIANVWPVADGGPTLIADDNTQLLYLMGNTQKRLIAYDPLFGQSWQTQITLPDALGGASLLFDAQSHHALALGGSRAGKAQNTIWRIPLGIGPQIALGRWEFPKANGATISNISAIDGDERRVFVGTTNAGVYRFQGESESYTFISAAKIGQVNNVKYDPRNDQGWIATNTGAKRIANNNVVTTFGANSPGVDTDYISTIEVMPNSSSDLGSRPFLGAYQFDPSAAVRGLIWRSRSATLPPQNFWRQNFANESILAQANQAYGTLYLYTQQVTPQGPTYHLKRMAYIFTAPIGFVVTETDFGNRCNNNNIFNDLAISKHGDWWLTSNSVPPALSAANAPNVDNGGICRVVAASTPGPGNFFATDVGSQATSVAVDSDDRVWVSVEDFPGGLVQYQVLQTSKTTEQLRYTTYLTGTKVYALGAADEKLWMDARSANGLTTYAQRWQVLDQSNGLQSKQVTGAWLARGRAFFTSNTGELMMLAPDGVTWTNFAGANAHVVFGDSRGVIWVGTDTGLRWLTSAGLAGMSPLEGNAPTGKIHAITEDKQGRIWIGHDAGLTLFDRNRFVATFTHANSPLVSDAVSALQVDSSNALWIGTDAGLNKLDLATWSAYNIGNGLPSANIHDLALTGSGSIAVSTLSGLAILSGTTFVTETMPIAAANLPLTVDEVGRLWAGTAVRTQHNQWQGYWTTNSGLKHSSASDVVADGADRVWFAHGDANKYGVSVRGALLPALDGIQPQISSVTPNHGKSGDVVTISGNGFGENIADVQLSIGGSKLDILNIRDDQIQTVIRDETGSGRVQLVIRGKSLAYGSLAAAEGDQAPDYAFETAGFCATPVIEKMTPTGGNVGVDVELHGTNFDAYWGKVLINGVEHQASGSPTLVHFRIQPNDVSGTLTFENHYPGCAPLDDLEIASAPKEFHKINANIGLMRLNQGYAGLGLVSGKPMLAQSFLTTDIEKRDQDRVEIDRIDTLFSSGADVFPAQTSTFPAPSPAITTVGFVPVPHLPDIKNSVNAWVWWPNLPNGGSSDDPQPRDWKVQTKLWRNGFIVAQTSKTFTFRPNLPIRVLLVPYMLQTTKCLASTGLFYCPKELEQMRLNVENHLDDLRYRMHPLGDVEFEWWNTPKLAGAKAFSIKDAVNLTNASGHLGEARDEWNDSYDPDVTIAFGIVDGRVAIEGPGNGYGFQSDLTALFNATLPAKADMACQAIGGPILWLAEAFSGKDLCKVDIPLFVGWASFSVAKPCNEDPDHDPETCEYDPNSPNYDPYKDPFNSSSLIGHELGHTMGLVKPSAGNAPPISGDDANATHSAFDELKGGECRDSATEFDKDLTLYHEDGVTEPVVNPLKQIQLLPGLDGSRWTRRGKALMAYACNRENVSVFYEPPDLAHMKSALAFTDYSGFLSFLLVDAQAVNTPSQNVSPATVFEASQPSSVNMIPGDRIAVTGILTPSNNTGQIVTVLALGPTTPIGFEINTDWELVQLDASNQVLARTKAFPMNPSFPHDHTQPDNAPPATIFFAQTFVKKAGMTTLQLRKHNATVDLMLDTYTAGANAPAVTLDLPTGGTYSTTIPVKWNATDPDGDRLSILVDYSTDDGTTWKPAGDASGSGAGSLTIPLFALGGSNNARIRVTANDGFHRSSAISGVFVVSNQPPRPFIAQPDGQTFLEGTSMMLVGGANDNQDGNVVATRLQWSSDKDGSLGIGSPLNTVLSVGTHTITLAATNSFGLQASTTTTVTIIGDYDMDGVSDSTELNQGMTPLSEVDGIGDPDGDGLPTNVEIGRQMNPHLADSDGDGRNDADEVINVTDPLTQDSARKPDALLVAPSVITFTYDASTDTPLPQGLIYVTTQKPVSWTASADVDWLAGTAKSGQTPDSFTLAALTYKLGDGAYTAQLTFQSDVGTVVVPVTLILTGSNGYCDINRDGSSNNSDVALVQAALGTNNSQPTFNYRNDLDRNGSVTAEDVTLAQRCIASGGDKRVYLPIVSR